MLLLCGAGTLIVPALPLFGRPMCQNPSTHLLGSVVGEYQVLRLQWKNFGLLLSSLGAHLLQACREGGVISTKSWGWWLLGRDSAWFPPKKAKKSRIAHYFRSDLVGNAGTPK
jgi:hypothetical protein